VSSDSVERIPFMPGQANPAGEGPRVDPLYTEFLVLLEESFRVMRERQLLGAAGIP